MDSAAAKAMPLSTVNSRHYPENDIGLMCRIRSSKHATNIRKLCEDTSKHFKLRRAVEGFLILSVFLLCPQLFSWNYTVQFAYSTI